MGVVKNQSDSEYVTNRRCKQKIANISHPLDRQMPQCHPVSATNDNTGPTSSRSMLTAYESMASCGEFANDQNGG